jgi:hypothetical protein
MAKDITCRGNQPSAKVISVAALFSFSKLNDWGFVADEGLSQICGDCQRFSCEERHPEMYSLGTNSHTFNGRKFSIDAGDGNRFGGSIGPLNL